jgi:hypothetical protein
MGLSRLVMVLLYHFSVVNKSKRNPFWISLPLKMEPIICPETPVKIYHYTLHKNPEERRSQMKVVPHEGWTYAL